MFLTTSQIPEIIELLKARKLGILPTDTIYGIHCLANDVELAEKVYVLKQRPEHAPFITLISAVEDLKLFDIHLTPFAQEQTAKLWPGPNTFIFTIPSGETKSFRLPAND